MIDIDFNQFLNPFDIIFFVIVIISIFFGIKNGVIKSLLNLIKWIIIFFVIKNSFRFLRPIFDEYFSNQTISDVLIFAFTLIVSYILLSFINRIIIGIIQPKKSGLVDLTFGGLLGIFRGYIVFVLLIFFVTSNISSGELPDFLNGGAFREIVEIGLNFFSEIPREIKNIQDNLNI